MNNPTITIVSGTYKRLDTLQRMVQSVRDTLADTVPFDFVIADNDSQDGTWEWLQAQPDVTALQMGAPVGAIKAFTEAANVATGEYVVLATDDIYFPALALLKALRHLEQHSTCGCVAFAHNKWEDGKFKVDRQKAMLNGMKHHIIYPQICMVRRWLGDLAGWWGGDHPHMQNSFTYGGDNYLGTRIAEMGYTIDAVDGCKDIESVIQDAPRALNRNNHKRDFDNYWSLYPDGAIIQEHPQVDNPQDEQLRVLLMLHYNPRWEHHKANKKGMETAFRKLGHVVVYDYAMALGQGRDIIAELRQLADAWQPHVIWTQVHNTATHGLPVDAIQQMRFVSPQSVCVNWNGDYWVENIENPHTQAMYRNFDLILVQTLHLQERLCELGICSAYMPHSFEPVTPQVDAPGYEIVFQGNGYTEFREQLIDLVYNLPYDTGLYGRCDKTPMNGETNYNYALGQGIYRNSQIAISPMQFDHVTGRGFVSNRMWEILASGGALCLQQYVPELTEQTGITDGIHVVYWHDFDDLREKIEYYMQHPLEARQIAKMGHEFVHGNHSFDCRIRHVLTRVLPELWYT